MEDKQKQKQGARKRKRRHDDGDSAYVSVYSAVTFQRRKSSGRPGSPHRYFSSSYLAVPSMSLSSKDETYNAQQTISIPSLAQVIHRHANGLCIVTVGETVPKTIQSVKISVAEAPASSAASKRKRQAKLLRGRGSGTSKDNIPKGIVTPSTVIATLQLGENQQEIPIYACVWGEIIELNHNLTPEVLQKDPLQDGFIAIILPTGPFPPSAK